MFAVIGDVMVCVCWGIVISLTVCAAYSLCVRLLCPTCSFSMAYGVSLSVLAVFLFIQSFLLFGADNVKDYAEEMGSLVLSVAGRTENALSMMENDVHHVRVDIKSIKNALVSEYPVLEKHLEGLESLHCITKEATPSQIAGAVVDGVNEEIDAYIWRRTFWMLGALVVMMIMTCLLIVPKKHTGRVHSLREARRTSHVRTTGVRRSRSSSRYR